MYVRLDLLTQSCVERIMARDPMLLEIRDRFIDRIDRRLALILTSSLAIHVGIAGWAWAADVELPRERPYVLMPAYQQDVIDVKLPDMTPPVATQQSGPGIGAPTSKGTKAPSRSIVQPGPVSGQALAGMLTGSDDAPRAPKLSLSALDAQTPTIGNGTQTSRVDDNVHISTPTTPLTDGPSLTHVTKDQHDLGRVIPGTVKPDQSSSLTAADVLDKIQGAYLAGLQRCYRLGLAQDASLAGRVMISFTVTDGGRVSDADASGMSSEVDACITNQMSSWRFPIPKQNGEAIDASFSVSLALQPS